MSAFNLLQSIARITLDNNPMEDGDYVENGLLYCGKCHTPKQKKREYNGIEFVVGISCKCKRERLEEERILLAEQEREKNILFLKQQGIPKSLWDRSFETSEIDTNMEKALKYVNNFPKMLEDNIGLLFWGDKGTGKTHAMACIANELIESDLKKVKLTSLSEILKDLMNVEDKNEYIRSFNKYDLLCLDDLGAERGTDFALENTFDIINNRYLLKKPLIMTTNLTIDKLKDTGNLKLDRIYDRILEMCIPIKWTGKNRRLEQRKTKLQEAKKLFE